jgi:hypothetical protein
MIRSYVTHGDRTFLVSTIDRTSSALEGGEYAETLVWEWDKATAQRKSDTVLRQSSDAAGSALEHLHVVQVIYTHGIKDAS